MASVNELLTEALEAFGEKTGPTPDLSSDFALALRRQLLRTLRVRIPTHCPGYLRDSFVDTTFVAAGTGAAGTDIIAWATNVHSVQQPVKLVSPTSVTDESEPCYETNPHQFWKAYKLTDPTIGTPSAVLVDGRTFRFRPYPIAGTWRLFYPCAVYPDAPADDTADLIRLELEEAVVAGTILFQAWREGWDDLVERFKPQWEAGLSHLQTTDLAKARAVFRPVGF